MRDFDEIFAIAAARKGGPSDLEARLAKPLSREALTVISDDRWLSAMAKCLFQAGFHWKVIEAKWDGFEAAFDGFNPARVALYGDRDMDRLLADTGIVRNGAKIAAVIANAVFLTDLAREHGSAARFFSDWPDEDQVGLTALMAKRGARLGGVTGQRVLRLMGSDAFILSADVIARLIAEGVVDKAPTSKRDLAAVQEAFNHWRAQSGRSLTEISQILAMSVGD
ncbi:DNA-3-methyladenine glycosylase I [Defluviimonas sp. D31]|uniref:DNA-3-methyladenine glycosylase I n=1 Tax=Defluviimonas sp. D31 TaxID=3083253 RepID=UPI00296EB7D9|nr:DNA-3-methyladenine glycosylase I [Defluviimonas sp. D31]MDW4550684.1 DNA-3-methyladenine glycosylase I [Defluviimonas sp. D31]